MIEITDEEIRIAEKVILYCAESDGISLKDAQAAAILMRTTFILRWFRAMPCAAEDEKFPWPQPSLSSACREAERAIDAQEIQL